MVEGGKSVLELLRSDFEISQLLVTSEFLESNSTMLKSFKGEMLEVKPAELAGAGEYSTNDAALAVARMKLNSEPTVNANEFVLMLDDIRDPGKPQGQALGLVPNDLRTQSHGYGFEYSDIGKELRCNWE